MSPCCDRLIYGHVAMAKSECRQSRQQYYRIVVRSALALTRNYFDLLLPYHITLYNSSYITRHLITGHQEKKRLTWYSPKSSCSRNIKIFRKTKQKCSPWNQ